MELDKKTKLKFNVLAIVCIIIFCVSLSPVTLQNDTYYTIKIGADVIKNGVSHTDQFSWHEADLSYTPPHMGYDVMTYFVYEIGGYLGIYIATVFLACMLGLTLYFVSTKLTKNNLISFLITIGVMYLLRDYIAARAQLVTFILFVISVYFIEMFLQTKKKRYVFGLFLIPIIIANIHLAVWPFYFVLFLPYVGEYIISFDSELSKWIKKFDIKKLQKKIEKEQDESKKEELNKKILEVEERFIRISEKGNKLREDPYKIKIERTQNTKWLILIMILCLLTGLLTPFNGTQPYTHLINIMTGNTTQHISEHLPMVVINNMEFLGVIIVFIGILMFIDTKIKLRDLLMLGGLLFLALKTRRQASMVYLMGSIILVRILTAIFDKYDKGGCEEFIKKVVTTHGRIITVSLVLIISLLSIQPKIGKPFIEESSYPVHAVEYIKENVDIENMRLFNEYNYGSYLLLHDIPVFIDSRSEPYAPEFTGEKDIFTDFINISGLAVHYEDKFQEYGITHVIIYKNSKINLFLSRDENYTQLYEDDSFVFYERHSI